MEINRPDIGVFKGMSTQPMQSTQRRNFPSVSNKHNFTHQHPLPHSDYTHLNSMSRREFNRPDYIPYQRATANSNKTTFTLGTDKPSFTSSTRDNYRQYPDIRRAELIRRKEEKLILGEDKGNWTTTTAQNHDGRVLGARDISYKVETDKYDTILGTKKTEDQIRNANNFEYYNPLKNKGYVANNFTRVPTGREHYDIITGRKLPF